MKVSFFEEFPNETNLNKLSLINFPTKLYLADYSIEGYKLYKKQLQKRNKNLKEVIWWPILNLKEGYWLSPWSKRKALLRLFHQLLNEKVPILWDAELPRKRILLFTQFLKYFKNKKLIKSFFMKYKGQIYTAEYMADTKLLNYNLLNFNPNIYKNIKCKMIYTSMHSWIDEEVLKKVIKEYYEKYNADIVIGLGLLEKGVGSNEKVISPEQLERDLKICKELNVPEVILFRLGGLNKEYLKVIKKFL